MASAATASANTASANTAGTDARKAAGAGAGTAAEVPRYEAGGNGAGQPVAIEEGVAWHRVTRSYHSEHQVASRPQPQEAAGRAHIVQARRRLLTTLVMLAVVALACTVANLAPWWILVPPVGMLGGYVLLLREAAQADAEQARWLAQEQADRAERGPAARPPGLGSQPAAADRGDHRHLGPGHRPALRSVRRRRRAGRRRLTAGSAGPIDLLR